MWSIKDDTFDYSGFYQTISMTLADREDPWVQDTLAWWNQYVVYWILTEEADVLAGAYSGIKEAR